MVLDLGLPDIAGREVLTRIRERSPAAKVVVFSGADTTDRDWISEHVEGFVLKDVEIDYLVDLLQSVGRPEHAETEMAAARVVERGRGPEVRPGDGDRLA